MRVAKAIAKQLEKDHFVSVIDFNEYDIPFLNAGEVERNSLTPFQQKLINEWEEASLVFVISPEYNWFPSAELVNMIHQLGSREFRTLFDGKVFAFAGVSNARGGRMPIQQLTTIFGKLINVLNGHSVASSKTFESQFTQQVLDEEGNSLGSAEYDKGLAAFTEYSVEVAKRWHK